MVNEIDNDREQDARVGPFRAMFAPFLGTWPDLVTFVKRYLTANPVKFQAFSMTIGEGNQPSLLLGRDLSRTRALIRSSRDDVFIGTFSQLSSGLGYPLPRASGDEFKSTDDIYAVCTTDTPTGVAARVAVWVESQGELS